MLFYDYVLYKGHNAPFPFIRKTRQRPGFLYGVPPAGIEPTSPVPKTGTLSIELWGRPVHPSKFSRETERATA